jgi:mutator protein MutT
MKYLSLGQKALIINNKGEILIIKRSQNVGKSNLWDFPGGRLQIGEGLRTALLREVKEETSMTVTKILMPLNIVTLLNGANKDNQILRIIYLCEAKGDIKLCTEHTAYKWIKPKDALKYEFPDEEYCNAIANLKKLKDINGEFLYNGVERESRDILK